MQITLFLAVFFPALVYSSPLEAIARRAPASIAGYDYQGCFTDSTSNRVIVGSTYFDDALTVEKCAVACAKFPYFGLEYGRECYCGDSLKDTSLFVAEADCSFPCPGSSSQSCGAGDRLNVYKKNSNSASSTTTSSSSTPTSAVYSSKGCYAEPSNGRALTGKVYYDDAMTVEKCASTCSGFANFGLEYYRECYCGNKIAEGASSVADSQCTFPCSGDRSQTCGGDWRLNMFIFGGDATPPPSPGPSSYVSEGCHTDFTYNRALNGAIFYDDAMTVEKCSIVCKGWSLFGVEYGRECFCGNSLKSGTAALASDCNFACAGDDSETCGAGDRLNIYRYGSVVTTTTSSVTSVTTTTTSSVSLTTTITSTSSSTTSPEIWSTSTATTTSDLPTSSSTTITTTTSDVPSTTTNTSSSLPTTTTTSSDEPSASTASSSSSSTTTTPTTMSVSSSSSSTTSSTDFPTTSFLPPSTTFFLPSTTTTSTTTSCTAPVVLTAIPETCWASMPTMCSSLIRTPTIPWPANTAVASQCRNAFNSGQTVLPAVAACFSTINSPAFKGPDAFACVRNMDLFCKSVPGTCDADGNPAKPPSIQAITNGGFESGELSAWPISSVVSDSSVIALSVSSERTYSGSFALKAVFNNNNGGSVTYNQIIKLIPGIQYQASWWWYSTNSAASTVTRMQFTAGGVGFLKDAVTLNAPVGQWVQATQLFTSTTSFGRVYFSMYGNRAAATNTFYVDDISIRPVE